MCMRPFKIRPVNKNGASVVYVPCGTCKDCRNAYKSQWQIRLTSELIQKQQLGWSVGFVTLTYDDVHLPSVPRDLLLEGYKGSCVPCFDKKDVRDFIVNIRRDLDEFWNVHGLVYMVCGEYGSHTRRPHYHCIFSWPPDIKASEFFELVKKYWTPKGFIIPKDLNGGPRNKPFVVQGSARFAGIYASKYTCKDLDFAHDIKGKIDVKSKDWRRYNCFHVQSRSLGLSWLSSKSDDEKRELLNKGLSFIGDKHLHQCPVYFRNKILFSPYYVLERKVYKGVKLQDSSDVFIQSPDEILESQGYRVVYRRLVRRKCTEFFEKNKKVVFDKRVKYWSDNIRDFLTSGFLESKGVDSSFADSCRQYIEDSGVKRDLLALWIVARHGVSYNRQFVVDDLDFWYSRYDLPSSLSFNGKPIMEESIFKFYSSCADFLLSVYSYVYSEESESELHLKKVNDMLRSI